MPQDKVYGFEVRQPFDSELKYFQENPKTAGMATEDNRIIMNPYSKLDDKQKKAVMTNEASRLHMRSMNIRPNFELTPQQVESFKGSPYENDPDAMKQTIVGRIISKDNSASGMRDYGYGQRADKSYKGRGYFGELNRPDGGISTEYSIGVEFDGKEVEIPTLVPTLTQDEINSILTLKKGEKLPEGITQKAVEHAKMRMKEGKSPFADNSSDIPKEQKQFADEVFRNMKLRY